MGEGSVSAERTPHPARTSHSRCKASASIRERRPKATYGHLLPQGEKEEASASRSFQKKASHGHRVRDSNGAQLAEGDTVTLIKDLKLKGSSTVLKRGTVIKNIHLTDDPDEIEGRTDKVKGLVLRTEFLRKA